jgi:superfamily I DNA and/or RNA helicase
MLRTQYRMNKTIMGWSNTMFYEEKLLAHESVENHLLRQIYKNVD